MTSIEDDKMGISFYVTEQFNPSHNETKAHLMRKIGFFKCIFFLNIRGCLQFEQLSW